MSNYVWRSNVPYYDYLQAKEFVTDLKDGTRAVKLEVSRQTREVVGTMEELNARGIQAAQETQAEVSELRSDLRKGVEVLAYGLTHIADEVEELNASFRWGVSKMLSALEEINARLDKLIEISQNPSRVWAYEQYTQARNAFRQELYREALDAVELAVGGKGDHIGYKLEYRFHQLRGTLLLGDERNTDRAVISLAKAEEAFLAAARYAKADYPLEAGRAFLQAGWAAYCQGKFREALEHTEQALTLHPKLGEAHFQAAKLLMRLNNPELALDFLGAAIGFDRNYALKASDDGDFKVHEQRLVQFLSKRRDQEAVKARYLIAQAEAQNRSMVEWRSEEHARTEYDEALAKLDEARRCANNLTLFGFLDAQAAAAQAMSAAKKAVEKQTEGMEKRFAEMLKEAAELHEKGRPIWIAHAPLRLALAEKTLEATKCMNVSDNSQQALESRLRAAQEVLAQFSSVQTLVDNRIRACGDVLKQREKMGGDIILYSFMVWVIGCMIATRSFLGGLIAALLGGFVGFCIFAVFGFPIWAPLAWLWEKLGMTEVAWRILKKDFPPTD